VKIEIKGVQFVNKGAELMLAAILARIEQYWPDADIVLKGGPLSPYKERALLGAYQKLSLRKNRLDLNGLFYYMPKSFRRYLSTWGILTEVDIDVVLDASGFAYGDQWGWLQIRHLGAELHRSANHGNQYIFLPQAFGPFTRMQDKRALSANLKHAALICARDDESLKHLQALVGALPNLKQYPDFTNAVDGVIPDYWEEGERKVCFVPNSNMLSKKNQNQAWKEHYFSIMTLLMAHTIKLGFQPVLLNHEGEGDREICHKLNQHFDNHLELIEEPAPLKIKGILGNSRAVVCSRFHGCVSALSQGVVCLGTSWSHKYEHLFNDYTVPDLLIDPTATESALLALLESALADNNQHIEKITKQAERYKQLTKQMWLSVKTKVDASV
jgi:polysaccharide pyruvyl transferase WcaK-like protein